ncbi:MAG TPA: hypothetical protein VFI52_03790, partial [Gemmatimonadaceae bacterium]|nr:hypothetical protein [Gemmatimonadaceae bacterium]
MRTLRANDARRAVTLSGFRPSLPLSDAVDERRRGHHAPRSTVVVLVIPAIATLTFALFVPLKVI